MKRIVLHILLGLTLTACSKSEISTATTQSQALDFGVSLGTTTKGGIVTTTTLATYGFGVFGFYDEATLGETTTVGAFSDASTPNFMYNQKVNGWAADGTAAIDDYTTEAASWNYTPVKYWSNNTKDAHSFFAYAPYSSNTAGSDCITFKTVDDLTGIPVLTYTLRDKIQSADFVAAAPYYNQRNTTDYYTAQNKVDFHFQHLLTRVKFSAYLDATSFDTSSTSTSAGTTDNPNIVHHDSTRVYLTKLIILGDHSDGSSAGNDTLYDKQGMTITNKNQGFCMSNVFTFISDDGLYADSAEAGADIVTGIGSWAAEPVISILDYSLDELLDKTTETFYFAGDEPVENGASKYNSYTPNGVDVWDKNETDAEGNAIGETDLFKIIDGRQEYLFLHPVNGTTGVDEDSNIYLYVEYDVVTMDPNITLGYSKITNRDVVSLPDGTLQRGGAYHYFLVIGMDEVDISATVEAWSDYEEYIGI